MVTDISKCAHVYIYIYIYIYILLIGDICLQAWDFPRTCVDTQIQQRVPNRGVKLASFSYFQQKPFCK